MKALINLVDVSQYGFAVDLSSVKEYSGGNKIFLEKNVVSALLKAREELPPNYDFKIMDGYRTLETQRNIVESVEKEVKKSHPENWEEVLKIYTGGYDELKNRKNFFYMEHLSGRAFDITLLKEGEDVDLGVVTYSEKDWLDFYENKKNLTEKETNIRNNRRILKKVLINNSFEPFKKEWWHWGYYGDGEYFEL